MGHPDNARYRVSILSAAFNNDDIIFARELSLHAREFNETEIDEILFSAVTVFHSKGVCEPGSKSLFDSDIHRLRCLTHIDDEDIRGKLAVKIDDKENRTITKTAAVSFLPIANQISDKMRRYQLSFEQALAWSILGDRIKYTKYQKFGVAVNHPSIPGYSFNLSAKEVCDAQSKIEFVSHRDLLKGELQTKLATDESKMSFVEINYVNHLIDAMNKRTCLNGFINLLQGVKHALAKKPPTDNWLTDIVKKHYNDLKLFKIEIRKNRPKQVFFSPLPVEQQVDVVSSNVAIKGSRTPTN